MSAQFAAQIALGRVASAQPQSRAAELFLECLEQVAYAADARPARRGGRRRKLN